VNRTRLALTALSASAVLVLGACSSSEDDEAAPQATDGPDAAQTLTPMEVPPTSAAPSATPSVEDGAGDGISPAELPAGTGLVLATELDTNAPVDSSSLAGRVTPSQVQQMRRTWNERQLGLDAVSGKDGYCAAQEGDIWFYVVTVKEADPVLAFGATTPGAEVKCPLDDALVVVDSGSREVLGEDQVALLL
jgi:hypothetical protein